jgi:hypothetical protein
MSADIDRITADYLGRLRRTMRGVSPEVVDEAEREIRAHIEDSLAAREEPTVAMLLDVLARLGPPEDYARDLGLYMMVDRGYRTWSVTHMARSTAFWALSTVAGAVVVLIFGLLFASAMALVASGLLDVLGVLQVPGELVPMVPGGSPVLLLAAGIVMLVGLTVVVRWFVGQYVRSARPHLTDGPPTDSGWVERTSSRILWVAGAGLGVTAVCGFASGAYRWQANLLPALPPDYLGSPLALVSGLGLIVLLLAPVLGLLWSVWAERPAGAPGR